ncbi:MAG: hypothetical protein JWR87_962 [Segetibacter sp.]|nr:hypothetical protein [Segetibacter sp.]
MLLFLFQTAAFHGIVVVSLTCTSNHDGRLRGCKITPNLITMFSKQEASQLRKEFWTVFGQYMKPVPSFEGEKVNWLNYKTGEKDVLFKMEADNKMATIAIEIAHADLEIQQLYYEQFEQLKNMFKNVAGNNWTWTLHSKDENGKVVSKIFSQTVGLTVFNKADWPSLISFFKPRIIALDEFWSTARYGFESLRLGR